MQIHHALFIYFVTSPRVLGLSFVQTIHVQTYPPYVPQTVVRGILANWLVCVAVFQAASSSTLGGKAVGIWLPIAAFVAVGLEHSGIPETLSSRELTNFPL